MALGLKRKSGVIGKKVDEWEQFGLKSSVDEKKKKVLNAREAFMISC